MSLEQLTAEELLRSIWAALRRIETNLTLPPAPLELPEIRVAPPDLTAVVNAVQGLNGTGPTAEEIARAIAEVLAPPPAASPGGADALGEVARALEKLDYRLKGMGTQAYGGGAVSLAPGQTVDVSNFPATQNVAVTSALPAGTNNLGYVGTTAGQQVGLGRFMLAGSGRMTLSIAGNLRAVIQNPAGSGKTVYLARMASFATATGYASIYLNPTVGVPTVAGRPVTNAILGGGAAPVTTIRVDTDTTTALGGGTDTGLTFGIPANARTTIDLPPLVLSAGQAIGLNVPFAGAADSTLSAYWWEA